MQRHSPAYPPNHSFCGSPRNLRKAADLLRVYFLYLLLSLLFLGFFWWIIAGYVESRGAAFVYSLVLGGPVVLFFSPVPLRFSRVYYPTPRDHRFLHFVTAMWFSVTAGRGASLTDWLCNSFGRLYLSIHGPGEKNQPRELHGRYSQLTPLTGEKTTD